MKLKAFIVALHAALFAILLAVSPAGSGSMLLLGAGKPAGGGGAFTPASLSGLIGWYDAQFSGGVLNTGTGIQATNGQNANTFVDRSGAGNHLTDASSGNPPVFNTTGLTGSKPAVVFADPTRLSKASYAIGTGNTFSIFMVVQMNAGTPSFARLATYFKPGAADTSTNAGSAIFTIRDNANNAYYDYANSVPGAAVALSLSTTTRIGVIFNGTQRTLYKNGVAQPTPIAYTQNWVTAGEFNLGNDGLTNSPWNGPVGEVIVSTSDLTANVTDIDTYLAGRW